MAEDATYGRQRSLGQQQPPDSQIANCRMYYRAAARSFIGRWQHSLGGSSALIVTTQVQWHLTWSRLHIEGANF